MDALTTVKALASRYGKGKALFDAGAVAEIAAGVYRVNDHQVNLETGCDCPDSMYRKDNITFALNDRSQLVPMCKHVLAVLFHRDQQRRAR